MYSVSQLNSRIKEILDKERDLNGISVFGQVSNYKLYPSGHRYFSLKDSDCSVRCVMFQRDSRSLTFEPKDGDSVVATGRVSAYPRDGVYQLYCSDIKNYGIGALQLKYERLKKSLGDQGLFDTANKKQLPAFPDKIALVTSPVGAAVRDMIRILRTRWPLTDIVVVPASVQGTSAPVEIAEAIAYVNYHKLADLIITGRGGGSIEDLWSFNEEIVARAIFESSIPVISAVGHEPDITISDYVADKRASTPSNAAEIAVPDMRGVYSHLLSLKTSINSNETALINSYKHKVKIISSYPAFSSPLYRINSLHQYLDSMSDKLKYYFDLHFNSKKEAMRKLAIQLNALSPTNTLLRGYGIATDSSGSVITASKTYINENIKVMLHDGSLSCIVQDIELIKE